MSVYSIELMDWTSEVTYIIPLGDGSLSDLLSTTPGTYTDDDNNSWIVSGGTSDNDYYAFTATADNLPGEYQIGDIYECMHQIGIDLFHCGQQLMDFLPLGDYSFVGTDQVRQYPNYYLSWDNLPDVGQQTHRKVITSSLRRDINTGVNHQLGQYDVSGGYRQIFTSPFVLTTEDTEHYGGFVFGLINVDFENWTTGSRAYIYIEFCKSFNALSYQEPDKKPGDKGFRPTAARTTKNIPGNGGRGTTHKKHPDYAGSIITQPGAPNESVASAIGSGFLTCYLMDSANLANMGKNLYGEDMINIIKNIAVNPLDFIVSLMVFPCTPSAVGSAQNIKLGGWLCAAAGGGIINALGTPAQGSPLTKQFKVINFGTVHIPENWGNYLDYSQTSIELYLPFVGSVNIDTSECMGGTINVQYTIDFFTGMCVANVLCSKPEFVLPSGKALNYVHAQHAFQGNCAIQIPLSAVNYGSMIGALINACTQGITNPVNGFIGLATDAIGGGFRPNVSSKGNIVANSGFCSVLYPYVRITRPITAEPDSYQQVMGYPSYINTTLGECSDLCVCDDIDLTGIHGATEQELNKIRQLCRDGVYV